FPESVIASHHRVDMWKSPNLLSVVPHSQNVGAVIVRVNPSARIISEPIDELSYGPITILEPRTSVVPLSQPASSAPSLTTALLKEPLELTMAREPSCVQTVFTYNSSASILSAEIIPVVIFAPLISVAPLVERDSKVTT